MRMQLPSFLFVITGFVCLHSFSFAQDVDFTLVSNAREDISGAVSGMTQDPQGFLWLATDNGLYKYDGNQYNSYHHEPLNPNSPAADKIDCIAADKTGNIWFAPRWSGLDRLDPVTGLFTHFRHNDHDPGSLSAEIVYVIMKDREGTVWIGTDGGLDKFDSKTNKFIHYRNKAGDQSSLSYNSVISIYEDKEGTIWAGTGNLWNGQKCGHSDGGLNKLDKKTGKFTRYLHDEKDPHSLTDNRVRAMFEDSRGNFWVGTPGDGLHSMDRQKGTFERHLYDPSHPDKLSRPPIKNLLPWVIDHITFITEDYKGRLWIGTFEGGLNVYDPSAEKVSYYGADKNSKARLADNGFYAAYKTMDNIIWIGMWGSPLYKISPYQNTLPHTRIGKAVICFTEDDAKTLWLGTEAGLIHNGSNGKEEQFFIDKQSYDSEKLVSASSRSTCSHLNTINYIEKDDNTFWLPTERGLYLFDLATKTFFRFHHLKDNINSLLSDTIYIAKKTTGNKLWIGTTSGLDLMDIKSRTFTHFQNNVNDTSSLSNKEVYEINIDKNQNVWVGTYSGLNLLDKQTGHFKKYLNTLMVTRVIEDSKGDLWCGTQAGLFKYNKQTDHFSNFTDESAIISSSLPVVWITEDHDQNLWLNTAKGIIRLNKERNSAILFGKNQGVNSLAMPPFGYTRQNGEILYGDTSGYFDIKPNVLHQNNLPPFITISNFLLNNKPVQPSSKGILSMPLAQTVEIRLSHNQNTFSFEFSNIDFISAHEDTRLFYKLLNYDNAWHKAGDEKTAYYFNLPPGKYIFKVKALNAAGMAAEKDIAVIITPPWWNTWWAYSLFAFIAVGTLYVFYRNRIKQLKIKQAAQMKVMLATQEGERKRISRDLHDEVGTKLSALKMFLSSLREKAANTNNPEIESLAESSEQFIAEVMQDVRRLLLNLSPTVIEEFGYTIAVEGLVNKINETKQIHFSLVIFGMKQQLRKDYELALYRITQELINNVIKHADAKNVALQIGKRDEKIILMIEDDGKGFDVSAHKNGYGLDNLDARTRLMQGSMTIDSKAGKGTGVLIEIPYNFN